MGQWKQEIKVHKHDYQTYTDRWFNSQKVEAGSVWTCDCGQDFRLSWEFDVGDYGQGRVDVPVWKPVPLGAAVSVSEPVRKGGRCRLTQEDYEPPRRSATEPVDAPYRNTDERYT